VKPRIIVSAVNLTEMGPLAVFQDALESLSRYSNGRYEVIALVHRRELLNVLNVTYLEFPDIKPSWSKRLIFEFWTSKRISKRIQPKLWLSMDNVTPRVVAEVQAVYCHNPSPFYKFHLHDIFLDWKFGFFTLFFRYLYAINIQSNDHVIVQQDWIRRKFEQFYRVKNVIVAHPDVYVPEISQGSRKRCAGEPYRFFYPAFPRTFKNMEIILHAARLLEQEGFHDFELWLTFDGSVNRYAAEMAMQFSDLKSVRWLGLLPRTRIFELYEKADCLLFPSKLETWGLPITEFKTTGKPILAANLPYAHETVGSYEHVAFFNPENAEKLADIMKSAASNEPVFAAVAEKAIAAPSSKNWVELWSLIVT
jgi:glycosyltransferase involved in cell wall biosynthesis